MKSISIIVIFTALLSIFGTSYSATGQFGAVDVVYILDIGDMYRDQITQWPNKIVTRLEQQLTAYGFGGTSQIKNNYGLVVFGGPGYTKPVAVQIDGKSLVDSQSFANRAIQSIPQPTGDTTIERHDGYEAIDLALKYPLRQNTKKLFIFISPRHRQLLNTTLDRNILLQKMKKQNIIMNMIVNASFISHDVTDMTLSDLIQQNKKVMGVLFEDSQRVSFYYNTTGAQAQTKWGIHPGARILGPKSYFTTVDDYVKLVEQHSREDCLNKLRVGGSTWDIKLLLPNDQITQLFNEAFLYVKSFELTLATVLPNIPELPPVTPVSPPILPPAPITTPQPTPCVAPVFKFGSKLFFVPNKFVSEQQARDLCDSSRADLADIENNNELSFIQNQLGDQTVWINTYLGNDFGGEAIVLTGNQARTVQSTENYLPLCSIKIPDECQASAVH